MRVLFVTPFYYPELKFGGPPQKIHAIARGLAQRGHDVRVLTFDHADRTSIAQRNIDGVTVQYLPWIGRGLRQWPRHQQLIDREIGVADIVHCYGLYTPLIAFASRVAAGANKPVVQEPLGMYPPRARNRLAKHIYNRWFTRTMLRRASAVIAASATEAKELEKITSANKIVFRRNGIDVAAFSDLPPSGLMRARWGVEPGEKVILFIGRLSPIKNLEQLILAFAKARKMEVGRWKIVLVGPSEPAYESRLRDLVRREGIHDSVVFAGPLYEQEQKAALAAADLFVLPSLNESFGNAAGEAVAAGVPVLLTETCGIAPLIHGRAGLAVPLGVEHLANGIREMLRTEVRDQVTAKREEVKRELSWDEPIEQTIQLYERILADQSKK